MLPNYLFFILVFVYFGLSCSDNPMEKALIGKWKIQDYRVQTNNPQFEADKMQEEIEKLKKDSYFHFYPNYEYEIHLNGNIEKGKWKINPKTQKLSTIKNNQSLEILLSIDTLNANLFVFSSTKDSITTQVKLYKEKN